MAPSILIAIALVLAQASGAAPQQASVPLMGAPPIPQASAPPTANPPMPSATGTADSLVWFLSGAQQPNAFLNLTNQRVAAWHNCTLCHATAHQPGVEFVRIRTSLAGWTRDLGLEVAAVDEPLRAQLNLTDPDVLLVTAVKPGSPAAQAELQVHDVLVRPAAPSAGKPAHLQALRRGKAITALLAAPEPAKDWWIGVTAATLDEALRTQLGVAAGKGLILQEVLPDSPAQKVGLSKYDVMLGQEGQADFAASEELAQAVQAAKGGPLRLRLLRAAKPIIVIVTPTERPKAKEPTRAAATAALLNLVNTRRTTGEVLHRLDARYVLLEDGSVRAGEPAAQLQVLEERLRHLAEETRAAQDALAQLQKSLAEKHEKTPVEPKK